MSFATVHYPGDGTPGLSASHVGEDLIMPWPSDRADPPSLLLLHVLGSAGLLAPRCGSRPGEGPVGVLQRKEP
jgi:hypothetical protein